jgi:hypothetical protein
MRDTVWSDRRFGRLDQLIWICAVVHDSVMDGVAAWIVRRPSDTDAISAPKLPISGAHRLSSSAMENCITSFRTACASQACRLGLRLERSVLTTQLGRLVGTIRRERLDFLIPLSERSSASNETVGLPLQPRPPTHEPRARAASGSA